MNKDLINLIFSVVAAVVGVIYTFYQEPIVGIWVFGLGLIAYLVYIGYALYWRIPGSNFLRVLPVGFLIILGGLILWFWPASMMVIIYQDQNLNAVMDAAEEGISNNIVVLIDSNQITREETTNSSGQVFFGSIPKGQYRIKGYGLHITGEAGRGENLLYLGIPLGNDNTIPEVAIFLGDDLFSPASETLQSRIFAHLWYDDPESGVSKVEIDWGAGFEELDLTTPPMQYRALTHEYFQKGLKTVRVKVTNSEGLQSFQPPGQINHDFATIKLK